MFIQRQSYVHVVNRDNHDIHNILPPPTRGAKVSGERRFHLEHRGNCGECSLVSVVDSGLSEAGREHGSRESAEGRGSVELVEGCGSVESATEV